MLNVDNILSLFSLIQNGMIDLDYIVNHISDMVE